jgi:hypothetical protein
MGRRGKDRGRREEIYRKGGKREEGKEEMGRRGKRGGRGSEETGRRGEVPRDLEGENMKVRSALPTKNQLVQNISAPYQTRISFTQG